MSIFLGYVSTNKEQFWEVDPNDYLPFDPQSTNNHTGSAAGFRSYSFGAALMHAPVMKNGVVANIIGLPMSAGSTKFPNFNLPELEALRRLHESLQGGYLTFVTGDDRITVLNGYSGEHAAYYRSVGDMHLVSNRLSLLLAFAEADLDPIAGAYMGAQGYIFGRRTAFEGISRLLPGDVLEVTKKGFTLHAPDLSDDYRPEPLSNARDMIEESIDRLVERCTFISDHHAADAIIPLSGGKDSRTILGAMCVDGRRPAFGQIYTNGYHYSPEVLSAGKLVATLGLSDRHVIKRPALVRPPKMLADVVAKSLNASEGQVSVFDHAGISQDKRISIGGHQNSLRDTSLPRFPRDIETKNPAEIVRCIELDKSLNPSNLLSTDGEASIRRDFEGIISDLMERGATPEKTPETFGWMIRTAGWVAITNNAHTYSARPIHPLLDRSLMRLALKLPREVPESEAIHFLAMARVGKPIWDVPFATQRWSEKLSEVLDLIRFNGEHPKNVNPFLAHKAFPDASHPYMTNEKRDIYQMLARFCGRVYPELAHKLPWIDPDGFKYVCREDGPETLILAIGQKGVFASILCAYFGRDLFRRSTRDRIVAELGLAHTAAAQESNEIEILRAHIVKMEKSIAQFVLEKQQERQPHTATPVVPSKGPWRFAQIVNCTSRSIHYRLRKSGASSFQKPVHLSPGEVFSHGIRDTGTFEIVAEDAGRTIVSEVSFGPGEYAKVIKLAG